MCSISRVVMKKRARRSSGLRIFDKKGKLGRSVTLTGTKIPICRTKVMKSSKSVLLSTYGRTKMGAGCVHELPIGNKRAVVRMSGGTRGYVVLCNKAGRVRAERFMSRILTSFNRKSCLLLRGRVGVLSCVVSRTCRGGVGVIVGPSPFSSGLGAYSLNGVCLFLLGRVRDRRVAKCGSGSRVLSTVTRGFPGTHFILALNDSNTICCSKGRGVFRSVFGMGTLSAATTNSAFAKCFVTTIVRNEDIRRTLEVTTGTSSVTISEPKTAPSVPTVSRIGERLKV